MRWALAGLLLLPVFELVIAIEVGRWVGALATLGALLVIAIIGVMIVRRQGAAAWRSLNQSLAAGRAPSRELADAAVLVLAGVLLILPGFLTDVVAVLLLFPLTRPVLRVPLERALTRAAANRVTVFGGFPGAGRTRFGQADVVEGEVITDGEIKDDDGTGRERGQN